MLKMRGLNWWGIKYLINIIYNLLNEITEWSNKNIILLFLESFQKTAVKRLKAFLVILDQSN